MNSKDLIVGRYYYVSVNGLKKIVKLENKERDGTGLVYRVSLKGDGKQYIFRSGAKFVEPYIDNYQPSLFLKGGESEHDQVTVGVDPAKSGTDRTVITTVKEGNIVAVAEMPKPKSALALRIEREKSRDLVPHLIVQAGAGTGKSTSLIEGFKFIRGLPTSIIPSPEQQEIWDAMALSSKGSTCMLAFNKAIADVLKKRVPYGVSAMTMHSLGLQAVRSTWKLLPGEQAIRGWKVQDIIAELSGIDIRQLRQLNPILVTATEKLVGLCKSNLLDPTPTNLDVLTSHYEVEVDKYYDEVYALTAKVYEQSKDVEKYKCVDFNDMVFLPVIHDLKVVKYNNLYVDECVPGWTPVMLANGKSTTIKEIVETDQEVRVRSFDTKTGRPMNCLVTGKQRILNQKPLVKIKVKHQHKTGSNCKTSFVICTIDHKIWTSNRGWVEAGQIALGDVTIVETAAKTSQKGKITSKGRKTLSALHIGNTKGLGKQNGVRTAEAFNKIKGGNGKGPTIGEQTMLEALGEGWYYNYSVATKSRHKRIGLPTCYKIDIANPKKMLAVEIDGGSHSSTSVKEADIRKEKFLTELGWTIFRVSNRRAVQNTLEEVCNITGNCPKPATVVSIEPIDIRDNYVYDITVERCHNFYANGILVHNCQDLTPCQQALAMMFGERLILIGDPKQAIYSFTGADSQSIARMYSRLSDTPRGCKILPLTVTRRCGRAIVREANKIVPDFYAHESNPEGKISHSNMENYRKLVKSGDMVICRVNAPLVSECFKFLKEGVKAQIQGKDIGAGLVNLIKKFKADTIVELVKSLSDWADNEYKKEKEKKYPSDAKFIAIQDKLDCLECFCEGAFTIEDVLKKIDSIFTNEHQGNGVLLSSGHKSKGLEADTVFFLQPLGAGIPHPMARTISAIEQETNLLYVILTRAREELVYVS